MPSRTVGVVAVVVGSSPSSCALAEEAGGERLGLPFVVHGGRLFLLDAAHERRVGRIDAIDHIREVFAVADRLIGGEGRSR